MDFNNNGINDYAEYQYLYGDDNDNDPDVTFSDIICLLIKIAGIILMLYLAGWMEGFINDFTDKLFDLGILIRLRRMKLLAVIVGAARYTGNINEQIYLVFMP